jgi:hypothetical protein
MKLFLLAAIACTCVGCKSEREPVDLFGPTFVKLPFRENFNKGSVLVKLESIPDRQDAILAKCDFDGTAKEWVQEGKGRVELFMTPAEKYFLEFQDMQSNGNHVTSVEFGISVLRMDRQ